MGYEFGMMDRIASEKSVLAFLFTVLFLTTFDFLTETFEYYLEAKPIYSRMLQKIYKELMIMGFVSFFLTMYTASHKVSSQHQSWIIAFDFVHYIIFFIAIFHVLQAIYIIILSISTSKQNDKIHNTTLSTILGKINEVNTSWFQYAWYQLYLLPFSSTRQLVEFKIIFALFRDTYDLPADFEYGTYLSGCFEQYSLKIINLSLSSWLILVVLAVLNFARQRIPGSSGVLNCNGFFLADTYDDHAADDHAVDDHATDDHATDDHHKDGHLMHQFSGMLNSMLMDSVRILAGGDDDAYAEKTSSDCVIFNLRLFFTGSMIMIVYIGLVYFVGQFYMKRLMSQAGVNHIIEYEEYIKFELNCSLQMETNLKESGESTKRRSRKMSVGTWRKNIETMRKDTIHHGHKQDKSKSKSKSKSVGENADNSWEDRTVLEGAITLIRSRPRGIKAVKEYSVQFIDDATQKCAELYQFVLENMPRAKVAASPDREDSRHGEVTSDNNPSTENLRPSQMHENHVKGRDRSLSECSDTSDDDMNSISAPSPTQSLPYPANVRVAPTVPVIAPGARARRTTVHRDAKSRTSVIQLPTALVARHAEKAKEKALEEREKEIVLTPTQQFRVLKSSKSSLGSLGSLGSTSFQSNQSVTGHEGVNNIKTHEDFSQIYFFKSETLYFRAVELGIMFNSLYLAMWVTNYITIVNQNLEWYMFWNIAMFMPLFVVLPCLGEIVKVASTISAISDLQLEVIGSVLEGMEDKNILVAELQRKIFEKMGNDTNVCKEILGTLFEEVDADNDGELSSSEIRDLLRALQIHYSDEKYRRLFNGIDRDKDGSISMNELNMLLFPEEAIAAETEKRKQAVASHVSRREILQRAHSTDSSRDGSKFWSTSIRGLLSHNNSVMSNFSSADVESGLSLTPVLPFGANSMSESSSTTIGNHDAIPPSAPMLGQLDGGVVTTFRESDEEDDEDDDEDEKDDEEEDEEKGDGTWGGGKRELVKRTVESSEEDDDNENKNRSLYDSDV